MKRVAMAAVLVAWASVSLVGQTQAPAPSTFVLKPARVFDGASPTPHEGWVVVVTGSNIVSAGSAAAVQAPAGSQVIDLPGTTLMPGLIDAHSHIYLHPYNEATWNDQVMKETLAYRTIAAVIYCRDTLLSGFTTLRDLGTEGAEYADVSVQKAINEGRIWSLPLTSSAPLGKTKFVANPRGPGP